MSYNILSGGAYMAKKKESDTLRQRKFAQQEFLKLKKMQSGELDAGPKPSEVAAPLTFGDKIKNIWYHDKLAIIVVAMLIIAMVLLMTQCATKTKYDATIVLFNYTFTGDTICDKMEEYLTPFCEDINGDGKVNVNVINCSLSGTENNEHNYSKRLSLQSIQASDSSALLYITDEYSYKELTEKINFFEGEPIKFNEDFYKYCVDEGGMFVTPKNLQISCRVIKGTSIENGKNIDLHYNHAQNILNKINEYNSTK